MLLAQDGCPSPSPPSRLPSSLLLPQLLLAQGDHLIDASMYGLPAKTSLRDAAVQSRSVLWHNLLVAGVHASLDAGCAGFARTLRRSLRRSLRCLLHLYLPQPRSVYVCVWIPFFVATRNSACIGKRNSMEDAVLSVCLSRSDSCDLEVTNKQIQTLSQQRNRANTVLTDGEE